MSTIGTGIAAGVANASTTARQAVKQQGSADAQRAGNARSSDKVTVEQLHGASATRDSDEDMPDQEAPGYEDLYGQGDGEHSQQGEHSPGREGDTIDLIHQADAPACSPSGLPRSPTYGPPNNPHPAPLFHQLDVTA